MNILRKINKIIMSILASNCSAMRPFLRVPLGLVKHLRPSLFSTTLGLSRVVQVFVIAFLLGNMSPIICAAGPGWDEKEEINGLQARIQSTKAEYGLFMKGTVAEIGRLQKIVGAEKDKAQEASLLIDKIREMSSLDLQGSEQSVLMKKVAPCRPNESDSFVQTLQVDEKEFIQALQASFEADSQGDMLERVHEIFKSIWKKNSFDQVAVIIKKTLNLCNKMESAVFFLYHAFHYHDAGYEGLQTLQLFVHEGVNIADLDIYCLRKKSNSESLLFEALMTLPDLKGKKREKFIEMIRFLVENGARIDVNFNTDFGARTLLDVALTAHQFDVAEILVHHGAKIVTNAPSLIEAVLLLPQLPSAQKKSLQYVLNHGVIDSKSLKIEAREVVLGSAQTMPGQLNVALDQSKACTLCKVEKGIHKCGQCGIAFYCSKDCQKAHWHVHKKNCKKLAVGTVGISENISSAVSGVIDLDLMVKQMLIFHSQSEIANHFKDLLFMQQDPQGAIALIKQHFTGPDYRNINECFIVDQGRKKFLLEIAIRFNDLNVVQCLVEHGADVNLSDSSRYSPLFLAVGAFCSNVQYDKKIDKKMVPALSIIDYLIEHEANVNFSLYHIEHEKYLSPLILALDFEEYELAKKFIKKGAQVIPDQIKLLGRNKVLRLKGDESEKKCKRIKAWYKKHGAAIMQSSGDCVKPISQIPPTNNVCGIENAPHEALVDARPDDILGGKQQGIRPVAVGDEACQASTFDAGAVASVEGGSEFIKGLCALLQEKGKNPVRDVFEMFQKILEQNDFEKVKIVIEQGLDVSERLKAAAFFCYYALDYSDLEVVAFLVEKGIKISDVDEYILKTDGYESLPLVQLLYLLNAKEIASERVKIVKSINFFVGHGARLDFILGFTVGDVFPVTLLSMVLHDGHYDVAEIFVRSGAKIACNHPMLVDVLSSQNQLLGVQKEVLEYVLVNGVIEPQTLKQNAEDYVSQIQSIEGGSGNHIKSAIMQCEDNSMSVIWGHVDNLFHAGCNAEGIEYIRKNFTGPKCFNINECFGIDPLDSLVGRRKKTLLDIAICYHDLNAVKCLVDECGILVNLPDSTVCSPLFSAVGFFCNYCNTGRYCDGMVDKKVVDAMIAIIDYFLEHKADVNFSIFYDELETNLSPLGMALHNEQYGLASKLIACGAQQLTNEQFNTLGQLSLLVEQTPGRRKRIRDWYKKQVFRAKQQGGDGVKPIAQTAGLANDIILKSGSSVGKKKKKKNAGKNAISADLPVADAARVQELQQPGRVTPEKFGVNQEQQVVGQLEESRQVDERITEIRVGKQAVVTGLQEQQRLNLIEQAQQKLQEDQEDQLERVLLESRKQQTYRRGRNNHEAGAPVVSLAQIVEECQLSDQEMLQEAIRLSLEDFTDMYGIGTANVFPIANLSTTVLPSSLCIQDLNREKNQLGDAIKNNMHKPTIVKLLANIKRKLQEIKKLGLSDVGIIDVDIDGDNLLIYAIKVSVKNGEEGNKGKNAFFALLSHLKDCNSNGLMEGDTIDPYINIARNYVQNLLEQLGSLGNEYLKIIGKALGCINPVETVSQAVIDVVKKKKKDVQKSVPFNVSDVSCVGQELISQEPVAQVTSQEDEKAVTGACDDKIGQELISQEPVDQKSVVQADKKVVTIASMDQMELGMELYQAFINDNAAYVTIVDPLVILPAARKQYLQAYWPARIMKNNAACVGTDCVICGEAVKGSNKIQDKLFQGEDEIMLLSQAAHLLGHNKLVSRIVNSTYGTQSWHAVLAWEKLKKAELLERERVGLVMTNTVSSITHDKRSDISKNGEEDRLYDVSTQPEGSMVIEEDATQMERLYDIARYSCHIVSRPHASPQYKNCELCNENIAVLNFSKVDLCAMLDLSVGCQHVGFITNILKQRPDLISYMNELDDDREILWEKLFVDGDNCLDKGDDVRPNLILHINELQDDKEILREKLCADGDSCLDKCDEKPDQFNSACSICDLIEDNEHNIGNLIENGRNIDGKKSLICMLKSACRDKHYRAVDVLARRMKEYDYVAGNKKSRLPAYVGAYLYGQRGLRRVGEQSQIGEVGEQKEVRQVVRRDRRYSF